MQKVRGLHHITAISGSAQENYRFYTDILNLRLVKKTVNFDDPGTYHLYYGDQTGSPGSLLTFFPYNGGRGRQGSGQATSIHYPIASNSLGEWDARLKKSGSFSTLGKIFDHDSLQFEDPHGLRFELYEDESLEDNKLEKFTGATLQVKNLEKSAELLLLLGLTSDAESGARTRFKFSNGNFLDLQQNTEARGRSGPGTIHHIALRVADDEEQIAWLEKLRSLGYQVSPVMDRNYFHSIYFRGPSGILFELATDPPGMLIDEEQEHLGEKLMLPAQYEPHRTQIEATLPSLESAQLREAI